MPTLVLGLGRTGTRKAILQDDSAQTLESDRNLNPGNLSELPLPNKDCDTFLDQLK